MLEQSADGAHGGDETCALRRLTPEQLWRALGEDERATALAQANDARRWAPTGADWLAARLRVGRGEEAEAAATATGLDAREVARRAKAEGWSRRLSVANRVDLSKRIVAGGLARAQALGGASGLAEAPIRALLASAAIDRISAPRPLWEPLPVEAEDLREARGWIAILAGDGPVEGSGDAGRRPVGDGADTTDVDGAEHGPGADSPGGGAFGARRARLVERLDRLVGALEQRLADLRSGPGPGAAGAAADAAGVGSGPGALAGGAVVAGGDVAGAGA